MKSVPPASAGGFKGITRTRPLTRTVLTSLAALLVLSIAGLALARATSTDLRPLISDIWFSTIFASRSAPTMSPTVPLSSCTSIATGDWNSSSTWTSCGGTFPGATDDASIEGGFTVTLTAAASAANVTVKSASTLDAATSVLTVSSAFTLEANSTFKQGGGTTGVPGVTRSFDSASTYVFNGTQTSITGFFTFGNLTWSAGNATPTGDLTVNGTLTVTANSLRGSTGGSTTTRTHTVVGNVVIDGASAILIGTNATAAGTGTWNIAGSVTTQNGGILRGCNTSSVANGTFNVGGSLINNGTVEHGSGTGVFTIDFNGSSAQTISGSAIAALQNVTVSNTSAAVSSSVNFNVSGTLNMNGAGTRMTLDPAVQINGSGNTGTISGTGTVQVSRLGSNSFSGQYKFLTFSVTALTVEWAGAGDQGVENGVPGYGAIKTSGSGTKAMGGGVTLPINGGVTIGSGTILTIGANNLNVAGNWTNNAGSAGFTMNGDKTVTFNGASTSQAISGNTTFANLTINTSGSPGTVSAAGSTLAVQGLLRVQAGTFTSASDFTDVTIDSGATLALSGPITVSGNWTNNGIFQPNGFTVSFDGTGAQLITTGGTGVGKPFAGFTVNKNSGTATLAGNLSATALNITQGTLDQGASFNILTGAVTVGASGIWNNTGTGDLTLSGDVANSGTINFNANGTSCGDTNDILIRSSDTGNPIARRIWSGNGTYLLVDVDVADQTTPPLPPPAFILVRSGTNSGNNGTGWLFDSTCLSGTYTWIGNTPGANTDWQVGTNWTPTRVPNSADILLFDGGVTPGPLVTNVPTQEIAALRLVNGVNGVTLNAQALSAQTLTLSGVTGTDLSVPSGTLLTLAGADGLTISLTGAGSQGVVGGQIITQGGPHRLIGSNAGEISFASGSIFTTSTGFTGNPFGAGTNGSVVFQSGSSAFFNAGGDPFGGNGHAVTVFNLGSTASINAQSALSCSDTSTGRTYGNLILDNLSGGSTAYQCSGSQALTILNDLTIQNNRTFTLSNSAGGDLNLQGNFANNNQAGGSFGPNGRTVIFNGGSSVQTRSKDNGAHETFGDVIISKTGGSVRDVSGLIITGTLQFNGTNDVLDLNGYSLTLNGTISDADASGSFKGNDLSFLTINGSGPLGAPLRFVSGSEKVNSLTLNRTSGQVNLGTNLTIGNPAQGSLTLTNGIIDTESNTLSLAAITTASRTNGYVIGNLQKTFAATGNFTFPVGTANAYSPLDANVTAGTGSLTVKAVQGQQPNISGTNALQRYWTLSGSGITANLTFHYSSSSPNDIVGTEANYKIFRYNGSFTQFTPDVLNTTSHFATLNGVSLFSDWTLAEPAAVMPGTVQFVSAPYTDSETNADHTKTITVSRTGGSDGALDVTYATSDGTATTADTDYVSATGTLHWNHGETGNKTFDITVKGDTTYEANETVNITLSNATDGATIGAPNLTTLTITNDDPVPAGATLVVNTTDDNDFGACVLAHCSLREAINAANFSSDANTIDFNIPVGMISGGVYTIQPTPTALPEITQRVTIDGATQTTFTGNTNVNGPEVVINGSLLTGSPGGLYASSGAANTVIANLVINGFGSTGVVVWASNAQVLNNYIGTDAAGTAAVPNAGGLGVGASAGNTSGYTISGNLISGNTAGGISSCDITGGTFSNNKIGTDRTGVSNLGNGGPGLVTGCGSWRDVTISGNTIAFNSGDGFSDRPDYPDSGPIPGSGETNNHRNIRLTQNSIFSNGEEGIDLWRPPDGNNDGVTPNDAGDGDEGGNHLQNFPVLTVATAGSTAVAGTLNTTASSTSGYTIEVFSNDACDPSGNGEGKTYLGSVLTGNTDGSGNVSFTVTGLPALTLGQVLTATATDSLGNTSEFSACKTVTAAPTLNIGDFTFAEGSPSGTTNFNFLVSLSGPTASDVAVTYSTVDGTTNPANGGGADYFTVINGLMTIPAGQTSGNIVISVVRDTVYEANETFFVNISNATNATVSDAQGLGTINNDDAPPATLVVNTTNDVDDGFCLPNHCSLREAINAANFSSDTSTINFNIPVGMISGGVYTIQPTPTALPEITQRVTIDGATQTTFTGNTNVNGPEVVINGSLLTGSPGGLYASSGAANTVIANLVINGFGSTGVVVWANNAQVLNNYIGTNAAGTAPVPNAGGMGVGASAGATSGYVISGNLISGNTGTGIVSCDVLSGTFSNNKIGTDRTGVSNVGNGLRGIHTFCGSFTNVTISNNIIAFNGSDGFRDEPDYGGGGSNNHPNNRITQNSFFENGGLGINLLPPPNGTVDGVTPNDAGDADPGGNRLQNFPVLTVATAGSTAVAGTLNTTASSTSGYTIEVFSNDACDPSGNGEGKTYLGSVLTGNTDGSGNVSFTVTGLPALTLGQVLTATATDSLGNTSEFSACKTVTAAPTLNIGDFTFAEGSPSGTTNFSFLVSLSGPTASDVAVTYSTVDGTTNPANGGGVDYFTVINGLMTIPAGQTSGNIVILVIRDTVYEANEAFFVNISNATNATVSDAQGLGTINNDDAPPSFSIDDVTHLEGDPPGTTSYTFTVTKTDTTGLVATVDFTTQDNTAKLANNDYQLNTGSLSFAPTELTKQITVLVNRDAALEPDETFFVQLSNAGGASISDATGVGTIQNDDAGPNFTISDVTMYEGDAGQTNFVFTVTKNGVTGERARVNFTTFNGTPDSSGGAACGGATDYISQTGTLQFPVTGPGSGSQTITVPVCGDTMFERDETFLVILSNAVNASIADSQGVGTILNDECTPPPLGMKAWWAAQNTPNDLAGTHNGTLVGGATYAPGKVGQAFSFDGSGDYVRVADSDDWTISTNQKTIDFWVKLNSLTPPEGQYDLMAQAGALAGTYQNFWAISFFPTTGLNFFGNYGGDAGVAQGNTAGWDTVNWHHVAVVVTGTEYILYLDGNEVGRATRVGDLTNLAGDGFLTIGAQQTQPDGTARRFTDGLIDEVEVFNRALSAPEITLLADASTAGKCHTSTVQFAQANTNDTETPSGSHVVNIAVTRDGANDSAADVTYTVTDGTATTADSDYSISPATGTLHWDSGDSSPKNIAITVNGDTKFETDEIVNLTLSNAVGATLGSPIAATLTITNDDTQPTISIDNVTLAEGNPPGTTSYNFTVSLSSASYQTITVNAATADDTAMTGDSDYTAVPSTMLTFAPNTTTQPFTVLVNRDTKFEIDEQFFVNLLGETNATILDGQGVGTITNDDTQPTISIDDVTHLEGDPPGTTSYIFTVSLSNASYQTITVNAATADDTAMTGDSDYTAVLSTMLTFAPNTTTQPFTVVVNRDSKFEIDEQFFVNLSGEVNAAILDNQGVGAITNDDTQPTISIDNVTHDEGNVHGVANDPDLTSYNFTVTLSNASYQTITVDYATANDSAIAPLDYAALTTTTLTFNPGETSKPVTVVVNGDTTYELNERFFVNLSNVNANATILDGQGDGTITNDDAAPTSSINDRNNFEGTVPTPTPTPTPPLTTTMTFTVTKEGSTAVNATVHFATADGGANPATGGASCVAGVDYITQSGDLTFPPTGVGSTSQSITIVICKDSDFEADETFFINLTAETNATLSDNQGVGTIKNDDIPTNGFVVTATDDLNDGVCSPAPGHCSLREAINAANSSPTAVAINFAIPANDLRHFYYADDGTGVPNGHVTHAMVPPTTGASDDSTIVGIDPDWAHSWWSILPTSPLPTISQQVFIEGYTQPGATVNTLTTGSNAVLRIELNGDSAGANVNGLTLTGGSSTVRGLAINRFKRDSGAVTPAGLGLDVRGSSVDVVGNFIGTDVSGTIDLGNGGSGLSCASGGFHTIGGTTPEVINLISGNDGDGINVTSISNLIQGNLIGTSANGTSALGNSANGITFSGAGFNTVGIDTDPGTTSGEGNTVAFNNGDGLQMGGASGTGNSIRGNSIFSNGTTILHLGIDLGTDGVTANDAPTSFDADTGPNNLQNFPVITLAQRTGSTRTITGTLNSTVGDTFAIDFYQSTACDTVGGNGEGQTYLGSVTTGETGADGNVSFTFSPSVLTIGQFVTATATSTGASFSTSEFSLCNQVVDGSIGGAAGDIQFDPNQTFQVAENDSNQYYVVKLVRVGGNNGQIQTTFTTSNGTTNPATAGSDYTDSDQTVIFNEGESTKTINIPISDDSTYEGNETVSLSLGSTQINAARRDDEAAQLQPQADPYSAVLTITENDPAPTFTITANVTHDEGNTGTTSYVFTVTKTGSTALNASVDYATVNGTATAPSDFTAIPVTNLVFLPAETTKQFTVFVNGDTTVESTELFTVLLSNAVNATIPPAPADDGTGTITNDDTDVKVEVAPPSVAEDGATNLDYTFTRTGVTSGALTVNFSVGGNAAFGTDYTQTGAATFTPPTGTVTFAASSSTAIVTLDPSVDSAVELDETAILTVTSGTSGNVYNVASPSAATGTITNDDTDVSVAVLPASVAEDGATNLAYSFTRNGVTSGALTVNFSVGGDATFGTDYTQTGAATFTPPTGTVTFAASSATAIVTIDPTPDLAFEPNETVILTVTSGTGYNASPTSATGTITNDDAVGGLVRFSSASYNTTESSGSTTITVERLGDTTQAVTVDYATPDDSEATTVVPCATINTLASPRCDFTTALGKLRFAVGETSKTFTVLISQDRYLEGPEALTLTLSNLTGGAVFGVPSTAALTIEDDPTEPATNPIDVADNFVRQHYHDFLNREPDAGGLGFWTNQITQCGADAQCTEVNRINVSGAFYLSIEFQNTGYLAVRLYKTSYGDAMGSSEIGGTHQMAVPMVRFSEFLRDTQTMGQGVVVGQGDWETVLENNKQAFVAEFVQSSRFTTAFMSMTPAQFVDALNTNAGNPLSPPELATLTADHTNGTKTRAQVLREIAEHPNLIAAESNRAFVLMQYFGYMRRNPNAAQDTDYSGYDFWLTKLNDFNGNFHAAEMVKAFISSIEYRQRFGP